MKRLLDVLPTRAYLQLKWTYGKLFDRGTFEYLHRLHHGTSEGTVSLMEYDRKEAIFVHIPKCAGIAVKKALFNDLSGGHLPLAMYCRAFEPDLFLRYFKFTFVRNPWDRLVSAYHFLRAGGYWEGDKAWFQRELSGYKDFNDFVCHWLSEKNIRKHIHLIPQMEFLEDRKHRGVKVDYVGFYENIDSDFAYIARRIGVENVLRKTNSSTHQSYRDYYREETRAIVGRIYARDIEQFGYDFDNSSLPDQITRRDASLARAASTIGRTRLMTTGGSRPAQD